MALITPKWRPAIFLFLFVSLSFSGSLFLYFLFRCFPANIFMAEKKAPTNSALFAMVVWSTALSHIYSNLIFLKFNFNLSEHSFETRDRYANCNASKQKKMRLSLQELSTTCLFLFKKPLQLFVFKKHNSKQMLTLFLFIFVLQIHRERQGKQRWDGPTKKQTKQCWGWKCSW